jgi:predicted nucleotidyltransferase
LTGDIGPDPDTVIAAMVRVIVERWDPLQVVLFGSRTSDHARRASDVDFLVVVPPALYARETAGAMLDALGSFPVATDIVLATPQILEDYGPIPGLVYHEAIKKGRVLCQEPRAEAPGLVRGGQDHGYSGKRKS